MRYIELKCGCARVGGEIAPLDKLEKEGYLPDDIDLEAAPVELIQGHLREVHSYSKEQIDQYFRTSKQF